MTTRWALLARYDIPDIDNPDDIYLTRWRIIETPWFSLKLHRIRRPDNDRALHDHPWPFTTLILRGGYLEEIPAGNCEQYFPDSWLTDHLMRRPGEIIRHRADDLHRIHRLPNGDAWTLVACGPRAREWGFQEGPGLAWVPWQRFVASRPAGLVVDVAADQSSIPRRRRIGGRR